MDDRQTIHSPNLPSYEIFPNDEFAEEGQEVSQHVDRPPSHLQRPPVPVELDASGVVTQGQTVLLQRQRGLGQPESPEQRQGDDRV
jgi:hypothetical protein